MRPASHGVLLVGAWLLISGSCAAQVLSQAAPTPARITTAIDNGNLVRLPGNVHPLARAESDRGFAGDAVQLHRMLLLLQRSTDQESALQQFLAEQQDRSTGNFQRWLTPEQFGAQYGPADADMDAVVGWLSSQGFTDIKVGPGRTTIELSGTVGQVRNAFHTEMHQYAHQGQIYFANATDPAIPAALSPVVAGIVALNNFPVQSHARRLGAFRKSLSSGETMPLFTFPGCQAGNCFGMGPADFATIYNTTPLLNGSPKIDGSGQGIAIVGESNIDVQDVTDFRKMFGLSQNFSSGNVILNGPDPGINDSESESDLDVQWSGAVAPGARIDFVTSQSTETTSGIHLSAVYIVEHNLDAVMSESFGGCEQSLGTTLNQFYNALWQQAAAQGITVILSSGDGGAAGCDNFDTQQVAMHGLGVSGFASTPYNVAVGGTDFDQLGRESQFWNTAATSTTTLPVAASAKSYIPEIPWNDSCGQRGLNGCKSGDLLDIVAGSGGVSTIYAKPSWQVGKGVPSDGKRDLPDLSLFASNGFNGSFYIICERDATGAGSCDLSNFQSTFLGIGGTSASAPAFAGIMALVNQKQASGQNPAPRQGNANYFLYALAQQQNTANLACNSSSAPASGCSFNDTTKGNMAVPCAGASPNCSSLASSVTGVLIPKAGSTTPAYTTTAGYDLATGLGTVNAQNLVNKWASVNTTASTTSLTLNGGTAVSVTHGQTVPFKITVSPVSASGDASLVAAPSSGLPVGLGPFTLASGVANGTTTALPGGTSYNVKAHYEGNGTVAASDSAPVTVTIAPESSKLTVTVPVFDPSTGQETGKSPTTLVYGSPYILRADVTNASGSLCNPPGCPTGTVVFSDMVGGVTQGAPNSGTFVLNSAGFTEDQPVQFPGGTNVISATYSGDGSFSAPAQPTTYTLVVTPAPTQLAAPDIPFGLATVGNPVSISTQLSTGLQSGAAPTGTVTFFDGATQIPGAVTLTSRAGSPGLEAGIFASINATFASSGMHSITAKYSGDASYGATSSPAVTGAVLWTTNMALSGPTSVIFGSSVSVTITITSAGKNPPITGQVTFNTGAPAVTPTLSTDGSGNQVLTATTTFTPQNTGTFFAQYTGDGNYQATSGGLFIDVVSPEFSVTANPGGLAVSMGKPATISFTVTPATNLTSPVVLGCILPPIVGVSCSVSPSSATLAGNNPVNASMTVGPTGSLAPAAIAIRKRAGTGLLFFDSRVWPGGLAMLAALVAIFFPGRTRRVRLATAMGTAAVIVVAFGCGGGSTSVNTGGGGGGTTSAITSTSITVSSNSVPAGSTVTLTATVTSTKAATGTVTFTDATAGFLAQPVTVVNGTAQLQLSVPVFGLYNITAAYNGDATNLQSKSSATSLTVTGSAVALVSGNTGVLTHTSNVLLTIQ